MSLFSLMESPERDAKYRYLSVPVIVTVSLASLGLFLWLTISLPWWVGLPTGVAALGAGFTLLLKLVNFIVPKKVFGNEER